MVYKENFINKSYIFLKIYYHISFQDAILSGANVSPALNVCVSAILLLSIVRN
jgi:hypothetical protein